MKFVLIGKAFKSFNKLKYFSAYAPILVYYNLMRHIVVECNMFGFVILTILSQLIKDTD